MEDLSNEINKKELNEEKELIIYGLSERININPYNNKSFNFKNIHPIYQIFHDKGFNIDSLIYYLSTRDNPGITDDLINMLYENFKNDSLFYVPQLCSFLTYKKYISTIENYLLDLCVDRMKFSLTTFWMTFANQKSNRMEKLQQNIEDTLVNNKRYSMSKKKFRTLKKNKSEYDLETELINSSIIKVYKLDYFQYVFKFYEELKLLCKDLKDTSKSKRNDVLKECLNEYNQKIENKKNNSKDNIPQLGLIENYFYDGILLPFNDDIDTSDKCCNIIVKFIPELSRCYNSKARVPILLTVECVKLYEIQEDDKLEELKEDKNIKSYDSLNNNIILDNNEKGNNNHINNGDKDEIKSYYKVIPNTKKFNEMAVKYFDKRYADLINEYKTKSEYKDFKTYSLKSFIFKSNDDLRQELLSMQLIKKFKSIFDSSGIHLKLFPYEILITSKDSGLMEFLPNTISVDQLKKKYPEKDLNLFFRKIFEENFEIAQKNFCESLAAYSLVCYFLEIRDRHNGNILIDINGNLMHIDFGFILGIGPGGKTFEQAPFKLTEEYVEILDGIDSDIFEYFKSMLFVGFVEIRKHFETLWQIIEITYRGNNDLPCFKDRNIEDIKKFFMSKFKFDELELNLHGFVDPLIEESYANGRTSQYDTFQSLTNGISS